MSDPALGLLMLTLIVVVIMMGFPTAFTLMGLGMMFGFAAFYDPSQPWTQNRVFDLMVERAYGAMNNESLISIRSGVTCGSNSDLCSKHSISWAGSLPSTTCCSTVSISQKRSAISCSFESRRF